MSSPTARDTPVVEVSDLSVVVGGEDEAVVVDGVDLTIAAGESVGLVGESGAGKSLTAMALTRMLPPGARVSGGVVRFEGEDLNRVSERSLRQIRGGRVGMVFQDPMSSLNPLMSVGGQIAEGLRLHGAGRREAARRATELLSLVGIRDASRVVDDHPHQFSGGMRQRVMIAIAVANNPRLLIADEPTTGLDVTVQAEVLALLARLRAELDTAILLITHDIGVVEEVCDRLTVLYGGRVAESGPLAEVAAAPQHPYTWSLIRSGPRLDGAVRHRLPTIPGRPPELTDRPPGCQFAPRCGFATPRCTHEQPLLRPGAGHADHLAACWEVNDADRTLDPLAAVESSDAPAAADEPLREPVVEVTDLVIDYGRDPSAGSPAVDGVSLTVRPGRVLGLIGESGSGKSSVARAIVGLTRPASGEVRVGGHGWQDATRVQRTAMRRTVQLVFQDPLASMNPRWRVGRILEEALRMAADDGSRGPAELLELVGLSEAMLDRFPDELSGGQRQRVGIARALAVGPEIVIADEPVSALDVSVQAQVINVLSDLRDDLDVGILVIAHDLAVAEHMCDEVAVMYRGKIVEHGPASDVLRRPRHAYTKRLLASVPGRASRAPDGGGADPEPSRVDVAGGG